MKEVRTKLTHGLSVSTTEDHLQNTAILLGKEAIPTKWSSRSRPSLLMHRATKIIFNLIMTATWVHSFRY